MANGNTYPAIIVDANGNETAGDNLVFTDSTNQPTKAGGELAGTDVSLTGLTGSVTAVRYVGGTATVAPTTGAHSVGDFVIGVNGTGWICTAAGTPGTWVQVGSILSALTVTTGATSVAALASSGNTSLATAGTLAFYNHAGATQQAVTGSLSTVADAPAKAVLTSIIGALVATGLVTNSTT